MVEEESMVRGGGEHGKGRREHGKGRRRAW